MLDSAYFRWTDKTFLLHQVDISHRIYLLLGEYKEYIRVSVNNSNNIVTFENSKYLFFSINLFLVLISFYVIEASVRGILLVSFDEEVDRGSVEITSFN